MLANPQSAPYHRADDGGTGCAVLCGVNHSADGTQPGSAAFTPITQQSGRTATVHRIDPPNARESPPVAPSPTARKHDSALKVVIIEKEDELREHAPAWQDLADHAMESNAFYEPWMLGPAIKTLRQGKSLRFILIYEASPAGSAGAARLLGFFPVELLSRFRNLPVRVVRLWKHMHCFLCTPLIRADRARETLAALLEQAAKALRADVVDFSFVGGDGPFHRLLIEHADQIRSSSCVTTRFTRAVWRRGEDLEAYLQSALSGGIRKEYRRQRRRLAELGRLEFRTVRQLDELDDGLDQFLKLEASGWKARQGTALVMNADQRSFVREAVRNGFARGQVLLQGLFLDDQPLAMLLSFRAGAGNFAFKIAYDETFAKYSPGVQMTLDVLEYLHADSRFAWIDSCAAPDHPMINRLLKDRKTVQTVLFSTRSWTGDLLVSAYPAGRWLNRLFRGKDEMPSLAGAS